MNERKGSAGKNDFTERRRQADWAIKGASVLSFISWVVALVVLFVLEAASPERDDFFTQTFGGTVHAAWNTTLLPVAFVLLILAVISCVTAFIFNAMRMRRKTDKFRKSIIIIGILTFVGLIAFTLRFGSYLFF